MGMAGSNAAKSKWYSEHRYGQDILYDACEKVGIFFFSFSFLLLLLVKKILCARGSLGFESAHQLQGALETFSSKGFEA